MVMNQEAMDGSRNPGVEAWQAWCAGCSSELCSAIYMRLFGALEWLLQHP